MRNWYVTHDYTNTRLGFTRQPGTSFSQPKADGSSWTDNQTSSGGSEESSPTGGGDNANANNNSDSNDSSSNEPDPVPDKP